MGQQLLPRWGARKGREVLEAEGREGVTPWVSRPAAQVGSEEGGVKAALQEEGRQEARKE